MLSGFYTLFIYPLELLFEVVFTIGNRIVNSPGWAIVLLSLLVNFLVLPLYNRAEAVQKEENELEKSMEGGVSRIKSAFSGDERMMLLQAYYKEKHYSPLFVLKSSVSLLLQIPFFVAAYNFLSDLDLIKGFSFGPIKDMGAPDGMLVIGSVAVNVLPVAMTLINIISGYIYTRGLPLRNKVQIYGIAIVFLVLLYNSPAGLVFYWTLNNVFSLVKNVFYKFKDPGFVLSVFGAAAGLFLAVYTNTFYHTPYMSRRLFLTGIGVALMIPFIVLAVTRKQNGSKKGGIISSYTVNDRNTFIVSGVFMAVLTGLLIPSAVIKISPNEFMDLMNLKNPCIYVLHAFLIASGFFIVWGGIFFALASRKIRVVISRIWLLMCPSALISYLFFGTDLGDISVNLVYFSPFEFSFAQKVLNMGLICAGIIVFLFLARKLPKLTSELILTFAVVSVVMSIINIIPINSAYRENLKKVQSDFPTFRLTTTGQNVMVIMLDRAPGFIIPYIFDELPYLYDQFDGFTYYPNTLSFGNRTKFASAALFGGYDYTPEAINADTSRNIRQKQNDALSVMPIIFRDDGFEVTLLDPPFANHDIPGDLSVFTGPLYEGISAYHTKGIIADNYYKFEEYQEKIWFRNFFCYSVFKTVPLFAQAMVYNEGNYNQPEQSVDYETDFTIPQFGFGASSSGGVSKDFMDAYEALSKLNEITVINDDPTDTFMYIDNDTAHDAILLQAPMYIPYQYVDNIAYDEEHRDRFDVPVNGYYLDMDNYPNMRHYSSNAAAYIQLGAYFDYMRENGVWDNTRIIIVSDHGITRPDANMFGGALNMGSMCIDSFNPILMIKDFASTGFTTDDSFMTNADVPSLALQGIVDDPVNPFTGNPITMEGGHDMPLYVLDSNDWSRAGGDALRFATDPWYEFNGTNVIDRDAWEYDGIR
ncbi:MAG: YidC/Oxa1 family membrane protein insertase [Clostridiales bacterium]|nr:YidC/Oxa1 family membrane protein insertase [Clostridiales bacterium]